MSLIKQTSGEPADLLDVLKNVVRSDRLELNTCLPAKVESYDASTQTCVVQPSLKRTSMKGEIVSRPKIHNVPVIFPRTASYGISFPIAAGDSVLLVFSQRSLDDWIDKGTEDAVNDARLHDITDAIAIPGLYSTADAIDPAQETAALEVRGDKIFIGDPSATPGGPSQLSKRDVVEALDKLIEQLLVATYPTSMGPTGPMSDPVKTIIEGVKTEIAAMVI